MLVVGLARATKVGIDLDGLGQDIGIEGHIPDWSCGPCNVGGGRRAEGGMRRKKRGVLCRSGAARHGGGIGR